MFTNDRQQLRAKFFSSWNKLQNNEAMDPLEQAIAELIAEHPEYHEIFNNQVAYQDYW